MRLKRVAKHGETVRVYGRTYRLPEWATAKLLCRSVAVYVDPDHDRMNRWVSIWYPGRYDWFTYAEEDKDGE